FPSARALRTPAPRVPDAHAGHPLQRRRPLQDHRRLVEKNGNRSDVYIRPLAYKSEELVANLKLHEIASDFTLIVVPFGNYLGTENLRCCTSSWRRLEDQMTPTQVKTSANYLNSILAKTESVLAGFDEAILLNQDGHVAEGSGENLFMMRKGKLITPVLEDNPLPGITRDTVMELASEELGIEVVERRIDRTELYLADEVFLTGTAAHLTPVISLDSRPIADGNPGPVSSQLKQMYFDIVLAETPSTCTGAPPQFPTGSRRKLGQALVPARLMADSSIPNLLPVPKE
ncbi:Probable branched-chain-amino-acid aminotransferase, partial [Geodia barretti]